MSRQKITQLTPEQEALIPVYREKWRAIALSSGSIDREKATEAIDLAYWEKYGKIHPNRWQAQWLLEETNAEIRRALIQGIGYERLCQELQTQQLDSWQEYSLLKIDYDIESIYLLKMTCPSTGHIHTLRVPPYIESAREAIRWVNWGIDPEKFSIQT